MVSGTISIELREDWHVLNTAIAKLLREFDARQTGSGTGFGFRDYDIEIETEKELYALTNLLRSQYPERQIAVNVWKQ